MTEKKKKTEKKESAKEEPTETKPTEPEQLGSDAKEETAPEEPTVKTQFSTVRLHPYEITWVKDGATQVVTCPKSELEAELKRILPHDADTVIVKKL